MHDGKERRKGVEQAKITALAKYHFRWTEKSLYKTGILICSGL